MRRRTLRCRSNQTSEPKNHETLELCKAYSPCLRIVSTRDLTFFSGALAHAKPNYSFAACAMACAFAPLTAFRNDWATAGAATLPSSTDRVVTLRP
jgi:hypothetical protein